MALENETILLSEFIDLTKKAFKQMTPSHKNYTEIAKLIPSLEHLFETSGEVKIPFKELKSILMGK